MFRTCACVKLAVPLVLMMGTIAAQANENSTGYFGANVTVLELSGGGEDASLNSLSGRVGLQFNEYISTEVRVGFGFGDDTISSDGIDVDVELDKMYGVYFRGGFNASEMIYPYVVLGYTESEVDFSISVFGTDVSVSGDESDVSYGVGADITFSKTIKGNIEYMNYVDKDDFELSGFSFGIVKQF